MPRGAEHSRGAPARPGDVLADKYMVVRTLASGGMGVVVAARHRQLGRMVAIKFLREGLADRGDVVARFEREARVVAGLTGEHVAHVFDVGRLPSGEPFIVMELLEGETLGERIRRLGKLPVPEAVTFTLHACEGLAEAHAAGIVHRDLKPANLFVCKRLDGTDTIKLLDFGISKTREAAGPITYTTDTIGTPAYMAPEQLEAAGTVDARADVWSLGAVLYEALCGRVPFEADSVLKIVSAVVLSEAAPLCARDPSIAGALAEIVHKCLTKDPSKRFQTVVELARALAPFYDGDADAALERIEGVAQHQSRPSLDLRVHDPDNPVQSGEAIRFSERSPGSTHVSPGTAQATRAWRNSTPSPLPRRSLLTAGAVVGAGLVLGLGGLLALRKRGSSDEAASSKPSPAPAPLLAAPLGEPLRVGVLHSLTGTMSASEAPLVDAALLAIARVNAAGGVLGRRLEAIVRDGRSHADTFVAESRRLLEEDRVPAVFGCWTSTSRRAVRPVYEELGRMLVYSVQYEGLEESPNILYLGAAPNQQLIPAVRWAFAFLERKSAFLVGSDYVFPRVAHEILKDELKVLGASVKGEAFLPLGSTDVAGVVDQIKRSGATLILNTINGDTNLAFLRALRAAGVRSEQVPMLSFSLDQATYRDLDPAFVAGDYMAWNYFEEFESPENRDFLARLHERIGPRPATDPMATTYSAVLLWSEAVKRAGSTDVAAVRRALADVKVATPLGELSVSPTTGHAVKTLAIGQVSSDGRVQVVWHAPKPVAGIPYPETRTREEWDKLLARLRQEWGGRWERPQ